MEWQPIETAPRDGTSILIHNNYAPGLENKVASHCWCGNTLVAEWWEDEDGNNGEWVVYIGLVQEPRVQFEPTHWMPLPPPPPLYSKKVP